MKHHVVFWISVYVSMLYTVHGSPDAVADISRSNSSYLQNSNDSFFESVAQTVRQEQNNYTQSSNVTTETVTIIIPDEAECTNWDDCSSNTPTTNFPSVTSSLVKQNLFTAITWASKQHNNVSDGKKLTETDDYNSTRLLDFNSNALMNFSKPNLSLSHNSSSIDYEIVLSHDNELDSEIRNVDNSFKIANSFANSDVNSSDTFFETTPSTRNVSDSLIFRTSFGDNVTNVQSFSTSGKNKSTIPDESVVNEVKYYETANELGENFSSTVTPRSTDASFFLNEIQNTTMDDMTPKPELASVSFNTTNDLLFPEVKENEIKATSFLSLLHSVPINETVTSMIETSATTSYGSVTTEMDENILRINSTTTATPAVIETSTLTEDQSVITLKQVMGTYDTIQDTFTDIDIGLETYTATSSTSEEHVDTRTNPASIHFASRSHDVFHNDLINFQNANISNNNALANVSSDDFTDQSESVINISTAALYNSHDQLSYQNLKSTVTPLDSSNPKLGNSKEQSINAILQENFTSADSLHDSFPSGSDENTELPINASATISFLITFRNVPFFTSESVPDSTVEQNSLPSSTSSISSTEFNAQTTVSSTDSSAVYDSISDHKNDITVTAENGNVSASTNVEQQSDSNTEKYSETLQTTESSHFSTIVDFNLSHWSERYETPDEDNIISTTTDDFKHHFSTSPNTVGLEETIKSSENSSDFTPVITSAPGHKDKVSEETEEKTSTTTKIFMLSTLSTTTEIYKENESLKDVLTAVTLSNEIIPSSTVKPMQTFDDITYSTTAEIHREGKHIDFSSTRTKHDAVSSTVTIMPSITSTELQTTKGVIELLYSQIKTEDLNQMENDNMITAVIQLPRQNYSEEEIEMKFIIFNHWLLEIMTETFKNISLNSADTSNDHLLDRTENIPQILYIFPTPEMKFTNITFTFVIRYPWKNGTLPYSLLLPILKLYCTNLKELMNATAADFFHAIPEENLDFLSVVMEKYGTLVFIICIITVGTVILLLCIVVYHRRKTRQSAHYLTNNKLHRNIQEAVGIDLNPAVLILQDEVREKSALNGNKICSLEDDEGWLAPYGDVPMAEDIQAPVVQDTKL